MSTSPRVLGDRGQVQTWSAHLGPLLALPVYPATLDIAVPPPDTPALISRPEREQGCCVLCLMPTASLLG